MISYINFLPVMLCPIVAISNNKIWETNKEGQEEITGQLFNE